MFTINDWSPLAEVTQTVFTTLAQRSVFIQPEGPHKATANVVWTFLQLLENIGILSPDGKFIAASRYLVMQPEDSRHRAFNEHISIFLGTVGSSDIMSNLPPRRSQLIYGPFLGCPILCKTSELQVHAPQHFKGAGREVAVSLAKPDANVIAELSKERRGRGRPKLRDGSIERAMQSYFLAKYSRDELLAAKKEALAQEAVEWVEEVFQDKISINTAKGYLGGILPKG